MSGLEFSHVSKTFGDHPAVVDASFSADEGEFLCLVGPSGCGKTTALRMIAGFETPTSGVIRLGGRDITGLAEHQRNIGITFQNYALFPHMTVAGNVGFGLRMRKLPRDEIASKVAGALAMVRLEQLAHRYPSQLSGGQQQRVALARAIVIEPDMLLLDEPLSNLDAKLREEMRVEIKEIQSRLKITTVFVTHDQEEALTMSDRIAVMHAGRVVQEGTPVEIFEKPQHSFVAGFIGQSNLIHGTVQDEGANQTVLRSDLGLEIRGRATAPLPARAPALAVIRHPRVKVGRPEDAGNGDDNRHEGRIELVNYLGEWVQYICSIADGQRIIALAAMADAPGLPMAEGSPVIVSWSASDCLIIEDTTERGDGD